MSKIDKLIKQLCPDGIKYEQLGENCEVLRGKRLTKKELHEDGDFPVFHGGLIPLGRYDKFNRSANQTMVINTGSVGEVVWSSVDFWSSDGTFVIKTSDNINDRFLYYFLKTQESYLKTQKREGGVPTIDRQTVENLSIPIPPVPIQEEIVKILDAFTTLEAELEAELEARKKQYYYYRVKLLSFENVEVEWKSLGDIAEIGTGSHNTQDALENGIYTFYARGITPLKLDSYEFDETAIITAGDGAGVGKVFHWAVGKYALHQRAYRIVPNNTVSSRYIYHYLITKFYDYIVKTSVSSSVTSMRKPMFLNFQIPIPSIAEQERIVAILDKFNILTSSLSDGLPKEIKLRKMQYEYYRNQLLTFNSVSNE